MHWQPALAGLALGLLPDAEHHPVEVEPVQRRGRRGLGRSRCPGGRQEDLTDPGHRGVRGPPQSVRHSGHVPPTDDLGALGPGVLLKNPDSPIGGNRVRG